MLYLQSLQYPQKQSFISSSCQGNCYDSLSGTAFAFMKRTVTRRKPFHGYKHSLELQSFALVVKFYLGKTHEFLQKNLHLALLHLAS